MEMGDNAKNPGGGAAGSSRELVESAFRKEKTGRIPVNHRGFSSRAASHVLGREAFVGGGVQQWREAKSLWEGWHDEYLERSFADAVALAGATGQDLLRPSYWRAPRKPSAKIDEHTYLYGDGPDENSTVLKYYPDSEQASILPVNPSGAGVRDLAAEVEEMEKQADCYRPSEENFAFQLRAQKLYGREKAVEAGGVGAGIPLRDADVWMEAMLTAPDLVRRLLKTQQERASRNAEFLSSRGFRYFMGGLDFASEQGPMFSPKAFGEFILPVLKKISEACRRGGGFHLFASDGNLWPVAPMLFGESGIDGYFEIDRKAGMDLARLRREYPGLTLLGNISSWTLSAGGPDDVREEVLSCLETAREYGGIIAGVSNYVMPETPPENIDLMLKLLDEQPD